MITFSFVIPHHNTPELLNRCIKSIPDREDIEIIVVDDNSNSNIVDFNKFPGLDNPRVKILFTKEGRGAGFVRNKGVELATGKWLIFADADDFFTDRISIILEKYKEDNDTDVVFFNALKINEKGDTWGMNLNYLVDNYLNGKLFSEKALRYEWWSPWSRMFKRSLVVQNNILFEELPIGNDMMFVLNATKLAKRVNAESDIVYMYYSPTEGSQTTNRYSKDNLILRLESRLKLRDFYKSVKYPFMFPIIRDFVITDKQYLPLLKQYHYNLFEDLLNLVKYFVAKMFKII